MITLNFENEKFVQNVHEAEQILTYAFPWGKKRLDNFYPKKTNSVRTAVGRALLQAKDVPALSGNFDKYYGTAFAKKHSLDIPAIGTDYDYGNDMTPICSGFLQNTVFDYCLIATYDLLDTYIDNSPNIHYYSSAAAIRDNRFIPNTTPPYVIDKIKTHITFYNNYGLKKAFLYNVNRVFYATHDLFYDLLDISVKELEHAFRLFTKEMPRISALSSSWNMLVDINEKLKSRAPKNNDAERLLYLYRLENLLGVDLASTIIGNIQDLEESNALFPDGINELQNLPLLFHFPNSLSRSLYAQYALQYLKAVSLDIYDNTDYSYTLDMKSIYSKERDQKTPLYFSAMHEWNISFLHFCNCFIKITIPITFWRFFISLMYYTDALDKNGQLKRDIVQEIIAELKRRLSENAARIDSLIIDGTPYVNKLHRFPPMESPNKLQKKNLQKLSVVLRAKNRIDNNTEDYHPSMPPFKNTMFNFDPINLYREQIMNDQ